MKKKRLAVKLRSTHRKTDTTTKVGTPIALLIVLPLIIAVAVKLTENPVLHF